MKIVEIRRVFFSAWMLFLLAVPASSAILITAPTSTVVYAGALQQGNENGSTPITFAVIGDYGLAGVDEANVAALVKSWNPAFVITVGDNNYSSGAAATIDANIGQYYHDFIYPYTGSYGAGAVTNRFFPVLGNHDWVATNAQPYLDYFTLPGNERYYDFTWGPVHFFAVDSDPHEPDGISSTSVQATWLKNSLAAATEPWKIVYFHHAPFSSGLHGSNQTLQWPYKEWGADVVLAGHDHTYERIMQTGLPFFVNGLGGNQIYNFGTPVPGSQVRYNAMYGAMRVTVRDSQLDFEFINTLGQVIDTYTLLQQGPTTAGVFRPSNGALFLKKVNASGFADLSINYGITGDSPLTGDWDGNGSDTIGVYRNGFFYLRNTNSVGFADMTFAFGMPGDLPVAGDWDGDGVDTVGVYRSSTGTFFLRNSNTSGAADTVFGLGVAGDVGLAGDWNGDGIETTGVFRPSNGALYLKNTNSTGIADIAINYGLPGDLPVVGDWDLDGRDTIGVYRNGTFFLRNSNTIGYADLSFGLGVAGDRPIAGDWKLP